MTCWGVPQDGACRQAVVFRSKEWCTTRLATRRASLGVMGAPLPGIGRGCGYGVFGTLVSASFGLMTISNRIWGVRLC